MPLLKKLYFYYSHQLSFACNKDVEMAAITNGLLPVPYPFNCSRTGVEAGYRGPSGASNHRTNKKRRVPERPGRQSIIFPVPHFVVMEPLIVSLDFLEFPPTHTCDGNNLSPRIRLKGLNAASIAVMVFNPFEKSCCSFTPWIIWNIPPVSIIPAGIPREGIVTAPVIGSAGYHGLWFYRVYRTLPASMGR